MALLRMIYDSVYCLLFYIGGVCLYYQYKAYENSMHSWTVLTCKVGAITLILLSANLFFSNFVNNFVHIIRMREVGPQRYLEETDKNEGKNEVPDTLETEENATINVGNKGAAEDEGNKGAAEDENGRGAKCFMNEAAQDVSDESAAEQIESQGAIKNGHECPVTAAHVRP